MFAIIITFIHDNYHTYLQHLCLFTIIIMFVHDILHLFVKYHMCLQYLSCLVKIIIIFVCAISHMFAIYHIFPCLVAMYHDCSEICHDCLRSFTFFSLNFSDKSCVGSFKTALKTYLYRNAYGWLDALFLFVLLCELWYNCEIGAVINCQVWYYS